MGPRHHSYRHSHRHGHRNDFADTMSCIFILVAIAGLYFALFGWPAFLIGAWLASSKQRREEYWVIPVVCAVLIAVTYPLMNWWITSDPKDGVDEGQWIFVVLGHVGGLLWGLSKPMDAWEGSTQQEARTVPAGQDAWRSALELGMAGERATPPPMQRPTVPPQQPRPWGTRIKEQQAERAAAEAQRQAEEARRQSRPRRAPTKERRAGRVKAQAKPQSARTKCKRA